MTPSTYEKIASAIDRMHEAHYWIHLMQEHYHSADQFRWYLNVFLKALKEIPQILQMELQNESGFTEWYRAERIALSQDPLISLLSTNRDFVVHRGMLTLSSRATIGVTEGRGMKLGLTFPVHPQEDSDEGMERYFQSGSDFLGLLIDDDDSLPCIYRHWQIPQLDREILDAAADAWKRTVRLLDNALWWLGEDDVPETNLTCLHSSQQVQYKVYNRDRLRERSIRISSERKK